jgi:hypothetical protein
MWAENLHVFPTPVAVKEFAPGKAYTAKHPKSATRSERQIPVPRAPERLTEDHLLAGPT